MEHIRVSPRVLGKMKTAKFCPRCFWFQIGLGFRLPFDMPMAGIMYNLDRFEKKLVETHFESKKAAPSWLAKLRCTATVQFPAKMTMEFPEYGLTLVGMPDAVFLKKDGSLFLVDYKTAKVKPDGDPFMPCYETQLLGYARLLEANGVGKVSEAALIYFDNCCADYYDEPLCLLTEDGMNIPFAVKIHPVSIDPNSLEPFLKEFRAYADMLLPPDGREGCKDCERLERLLSLQKMASTADKTQQSHMLNRDCMLDMMANSRAATLIAESRRLEEAIGEEELSILDSAPGPMDL
jgi:hypothetical protein